MLPASLGTVALLALSGDAFAGDHISLEAVLQAVAGIHNDRFGAGVAIAQDILVVGAPRAGVDGEAYVFRRSGTDWWQEATLVPSAAGGPSGGRFGTAVAVSDHHVAVGAPWEPTGSVYVFVRDTTGWVEQARLAPPSLALGDALGAALALDGGTLLAGAPSGAPSPTTGAAHVFARTGTSWAHQAVLVGSDATASARFGSSVSLSGDTAAVGAMNHGSGQGKAFVFTRSGSQWTEQAGLQPPNLGPIDRVGEAIATSGSALAVGSRYFENGTGSPVGGVFVYTRSGSTWTLTQTVLPNPVAGYSAFGTSLAMTADLMMIGAADDSSISSPNGSAFVYRRNGTHWTERKWLFDFVPGTTGNHFGAAVGLDGTRLTVGAPRSGGLSIKEGRAYVYTVRPAGNSYCTAGVSNTGCQAWLCTSGVASATAPAGFQVIARGDPGRDLGAPLLRRQRTSSRALERDEPAVRRAARAPRAPEGLAGDLGAVRRLLLRRPEHLVVPHLHQARPQPGSGDRGSSAVLVPRLPRDLRRHADVGRGGVHGRPVASPHPRGCRYCER